MQPKKQEFLHLTIQKKIQEKMEPLPYMSPIPSERELCDEYGVSRPTIRKALSEMEQTGLLSRIQGKGSFYIGNKVSIDYSDSDMGLGLTQTLLSSGKVTHSHVLKQEIELPDSKLAGKLHIPENEFVFHLKRLRYVNEEIYSLADDYIPLKICPGLVEVDFSASSLLKTLAQNNIFSYREDKIIEFGRASPITGLHLRLKKGAPISVTHITVYDKDDNIILYATSKSDAYKSRFRITSYTKR